MPRIALGIEYDGSRFLGWQTQPGGCTVQDALEPALSAIAGAPVSVSAAGRTDRGVHARLQVVHFDTDAQRPPGAWVRGVNALLPDSVAVLWSREVDREFHARYSAVSRTYRYELLNRDVRPGLGAARLGRVPPPPAPAKKRRGGAARLVPPAARSGKDARGRGAPRRRARLLRVPLLRVPGEDAGAHASLARGRGARRAHRLRAARERLPAPHGAQYRRHADLRRQRQASAVVGEGRASFREAERGGSDLRPGRSLPREDP